MKEPFIVLATYEPKVWKSWRIGPELCAITAGHGLKPHVDPKHPAQDWVPWVDEALHAEVRIWTVANKSGAGWHQDGDTTSGSDMNCALVLWADWKPTEFIYKGCVYQPKPYELVIALNQGCAHRRPPELMAESQRWVFRQRVKVPTGKDWNFPPYD